MNHENNHPINNEVLSFAADVDARLCKRLLQDIGGKAPEEAMQNCCWANVVALLIKARGKKFSHESAVSVLRTINKQCNGIGSPFLLMVELQDVGLPITIVEYMPENMCGQTIIEADGPVVGFANTGLHYQIWLAPECALRESIIETAKEYFPRRNRGSPEQVARAYIPPTQAELDNERKARQLQAAYDQETHGCELKVDPRVDSDTARAIDHSLRYQHADADLKRVIAESRLVDQRNRTARLAQEVADHQLALSLSGAPKVQETRGCELKVDAPDPQVDSDTTRAIADSLRYSRADSDLQRVIVESRLSDQHNTRLVQEAADHQFALSLRGAPKVDRHKRIMDSLAETQATLEAIRGRINRM